MDRSLVERARGGDRDAYEALARASARRLYLTAYRIVRDADQAEDAVQQTLVAIWRELSSLCDPDRFLSWTYRLVVRFCLAESRRHRRAGIRQIPIDELLPSRADDFAESDLRDQLSRLRLRPVRRRRRRLEARVARRRDQRLHQPALEVSGRPHPGRRPWPRWPSPSRSTLARPRRAP